MADHTTGPTPSDPTPSDPTPSEQPAPEQTPSDQARTDPTPAEPTPADPTPAEQPAPEPAGTEPKPPKQKKTKQKKTKVGTSAPSGVGRRLALAGTRGLLGLIGVGIAGASVLAATLIPLPHVGVGPHSTVVSPEAAIQQRICAGPLLQLGDNLGLDATTAISVGRAAVTFAATAGTPMLEDMQPTENAENTPSGRLVLPPPPLGEEPGILAGSQSQSVDGAEIIGFAASECALPKTESWLVGGSTTTGRTTLLSLNNPSNVNATVTLTIYSENGQVNAAGTEGIVVPPGGRQVLSLAGFAPGIASPVVKVESEGGRVTASLQQSIVRVLTPGGVDMVAAGTAPATMTVIPGIVIAGQENVTAASALGGYDDLAGALRLFVPGDGPAEVTITALPEDGSSPGQSSTFTVQGGMVTDLSLSDFTDGTWTLTVASDRPAVAAARTSTLSLNDAALSTPETDLDAEISAVRATDFAWFASAPPLSADSLVSVAHGPSPVLHLVNAGANDATITIESPESGATTVTVPAGHAFAVSVKEASNYTLSGVNGIRVSVSYHGDGALSGFVVNPPHRASQAVTVFNQYG